MHEMSSVQHIPVMLEVALGFLNCRKGGLYVDGTLGGGSYAEAILNACAPDGILIGLDRDAEAIKRVAFRLFAYRDRMILEKANFCELPEVLRKHNYRTVDGIVIDLGVSTQQLSDPLRGFSFLADGPLDMRMDQSLTMTAADLVNTLPQSHLADLIRKLGEEKWASRIARAIAARRKERPLRSTVELAELIEAVVPKSKDTLRIHPATRTFQALRIEVNQELESLNRFLDIALDVLKPGGRLCILAFHSLEDRLVKSAFKKWAGSCTCPKDFPQCRCSARSQVRLLTKRPVRPSAEEMERNPRSRSARLRVVEKAAY